MKQPVRGHKLGAHGLWLCAGAAFIRGLVELTRWIEADCVFYASSQKIKQFGWGPCRY